MGGQEVVAKSPPISFFPEKLLMFKNSESIETFKKELYHSLGHRLVTHSIAIILKG